MVLPDVSLRCCMYRVALTDISTSSTPFQSIFFPAHFLIFEIFNSGSSNSSPSFSSNHQAQTKAKQGQGQGILTIHGCPCRMCEGDCTKRSRAPFCLFEELISSEERFGFAGCVGLAMEGCRRSRSSSVGETLGKAGVVLCALKPGLVQEAWRYPRRE